VTTALFYVVKIVLLILVLALAIVLELAHADERIKIIAVIKLVKKIS